MSEDWDEDFEAWRQQRAEELKRFGVQEMEPSWLTAQAAFRAGKLVREESMIKKIQERMMALQKPMAPGEKHPSSLIELQRLLWKVRLP